MLWIFLGICLITPIAANDCPNKLMEYVKTNPLALLQINGFIFNGQYDQLIDYGLSMAKTVCGVSGTSELEIFLEQNAVLISLIKDLLAYVTPTEREQLKNWVLGDQKLAISGFMMQKALEFAFNPEVTSKIFKLMTQVPLSPSLAGVNRVA